jgi:two-component system sensor histidine kinase HydH
MLDMRVGDPVRLMRWSRWGILIIAGLMATGMVLSSWSNHERVQDISQTLIRAQGQLLLEGVRQAARQLEGPPGPKDFVDMLESLQGQGLRYLAMPLPMLAEAGTPVGGPPLIDPVPDGAPPETDFIEVGDRVRMLWRAPAPPPLPPGVSTPWERRALPSRPEGVPLLAPAEPGRSPPRGRRGSGLPPTIFEFEPSATRELLASSRRSLIFSSVTSAVMMLAALAAFRWIRRREAMQDQLARERHLATLGQMSAVMAHELRNPLASLKGHAQLLAEALPEGRSRTKAERVVKEAVRLEDLTASLLSFVRTGTIQRQEADPVSVVRAAAEEVDPRRIEVDVQAAPPTWSLDSARMQQVLSNLLRNAVQASPAGAPVFARVATDAGSLIYEVRDQGTGIPAGLETVIFEPFHTQRPLGNGLGLAVARRVVELHGGSIHASNHPEGGALFRVRIPLAA